MIDVLRRPGVVSLLCAAVVGRLPTAMVALALVRLVLDHGGEYGFASALTAAYIVASTVGQLALSRMIDHVGRPRRLIVSSAVVSSISFASIALLYPRMPGVVVALTMVAGLATPPIEAVLRTLWPALVSEPRSLASAHAVDAAAQEARYILAPLLTAGVIALAGANGNLFVIAALGLLGAFMFAARPALAHVVIAPVADAVDPAPSMRRPPLGSPPFRRLLLLTLGVASPIGAVTIVASAYAESMGVPEFGAVALALNATAALIGALLIGRWPPRVGPERAVRPLALVFLLLNAPLALVDAPIVVWAGAALISGLLFAPVLTQIFAVTPRVVDRARSTEANAWVISIFAVGSAVGTLVTGSVIQWLGIALGVPVGVLLIVLIGAACAAPASARGVCSP